MAVLTSPRRARPRFGPQAGLVAATRGVAFAALMAAGIGLLILIVAAVFLIALGAGILIVGSGGPHEERVLLGFLAIGSGLGLIRFRSEERRVGKECRYGGSRYQSKECGWD